MLTNPETMEDDRIVAKCYVELGYVTKEKGEYDESLSYHRRSMEIFERIDDALSVADSHLNIAEIYKVKGEFKQAMSEYEKGLTLYEDVYVEDVNKNSDSGTDGSLTSSFSDPQHTRSLSKSDEILSQTTLINIIEKDIPLPSPQHPSNDVINTATSSLDLLDSSTKKVNEFEDVSQLTTNIDDSSLITSKKVTNEIGKLLSSGSKSDLQSVNTNNKILPLSPADLAYATIPEESDILEIGAPFLPPVESTDPLLLNTKLEDTNNSNPLTTNVNKNIISNDKNRIDNALRLWHRLPNKPLLIILLSTFLVGVLFWWSYNVPIKSLLSCSSSNFGVPKNSHTDNPDDLSEQLRKLLAWRKDRMPPINKNNARIIEEFLTSSDSQTKMTLDKFQQILNVLDLKIILIPK